MPNLKLVDKDNEGPQIPSTPQVDVMSLPEISCDSCGGKLFQEAVALRKMSALLSKDGKEGLVPIPKIYCIACKHTLEKI